MGEYARHNGRKIKIGTCEQMYYLRADQVKLITPEPASVNPLRRDIAERIRFRFPFPDEDNLDPGCFEKHDAATYLYGAEIPAGVEHGSLQFTRNYPEAGGVILSTPCPFSDAGKASGLRFALNGFPGHVGIHSQRLVDGQLRLVCKCGGCGSLWRIDSLEEAAPLVDLLRRYCDKTDAARTYYETLAQRIVDGYTLPNYWTA